MKKREWTAKRAAAGERRYGRRRKEDAEKEDAYLSQELLEKRNHRRNNNKIAAAKYRQKKIDRIQKLEADVERLTKELALQKQKNAILVELLKKHSIPFEEQMLSAANVVEAMKALEIMECEKCSSEEVPGGQSSLATSLSQPFQEKQADIENERPKCRNNSIPMEEDIEGWNDKEVVGTEKDPKLSLLNGRYSDRPTHIEGFVLPNASSGSPLQGDQSTGSTPISTVFYNAVNVLSPYGPTGLSPVLDICTTTRITPSTTSPIEIHSSPLSPMKG